MERSKVLLLEMKRNAGLASADECALLDSLPVVSGNGLVTPRPARDAEAWVARWADVTQASFAAPEPEAPAPAAAPAAPPPAASPSAAPEPAPAAPRSRPLGRG